MNTRDPQTDRATVVAEPAWLHALYWIGFPALGAGVGWLLRLAANWAQQLEWVPFQGPLRLVNSIPEPQVTIGAIVLGVLAGMFVAFLAKHEALQVTISDEQIALQHKGKSREIERSDIGAVFRDGNKLVVVGQRGEELANHATDVSTKKYEQAFRAHAYPWTEGDPYADKFRRWVPDTPDLPTGGNALFAARAKALQDDQTDDARELREELAKLGVVVKDDKKKQYWRLIEQDG